MPYTFDGVALPLVESAIFPFLSTMATADTPLRAGGYVGTRRAGTRVVTILGRLTGTSYPNLRANWSALQAAHDVTGPRLLVVRDGWYFHATPDSLTESEVEVSNLKYQIDYKCADPYEYSSTLSSAALSTNGTATVNVGGNVPALPTITVNIATGTAGGYVTIANTTTGETSTVLAEAAMQIQIDSRIEKVVIGQPRLLVGQYISLAKNTQNTLTVTPSSGVSLSSVPMTWRDRSV